MSIISFESRLASEESLETFLQTLMAYPWRYTIKDLLRRWVKEMENGKGFVIPTAVVAKIAPNPQELCDFVSSIMSYTNRNHRSYLSPKFIKFFEDYIQNYEDKEEAAKACIRYSYIMVKRFGEETILRVADRIGWWVDRYCERFHLVLGKDGFTTKTAKKKKAYGLDQSGVVKDQNDIGSGQQNILDIMKQDADVHPQEVLLKQREKDEQPPRKYRSVI